MKVKYSYIYTIQAILEMISLEIQRAKKFACSTKYTRLTSVIDFCHNQVGPFTDYLAIIAAW